MRRPAWRVSGRAVAGALLLLALVSLDGPGAPVAAHPAGRIVHALPPVADPGAEIAVGGSSLWSDADVTLTLERTGVRAVVLGGARTAGDGTLVARLRLPDGLPGGAWTLVVRHPSGEVAEAPLAVRDAPAPLAVALLVALLLLAIPFVRRLRRPPVPPPPVSRP